MRPERFLECLDSYKGIVESPMGSNNTPIGREFGWSGVAWCAMTQSLALCGAKWNGRSFDYSGGFWDGSKLVIPGISTDFRKGWANVQSMASAFRRAGRAGGIPRFPCHVAWQWSSNPQDSHIGAATRRGSIVTFEGNHRDRAEYWTRDEQANVIAYLYPPFDTSSPGPSPTPSVVGVWPFTEE